MECRRSERRILSATVRIRLAAIAAACAAFTLSAQRAEAQTGYDVVAQAQTYLGVPYVYGGASYAGVDCSGLVSAVYGDLGIYVPHSAYSQYYVGTPVSYPGPGDIVLSDYGYGFSSHAGIATGDGYMIDAPYPGSVVRYDPIIPTYVNGYRSIV
jgi:cell wall-associated NlpC family hydrolase